MLFRGEKAAPLGRGVDRLIELKVPVVTVVADCPECARLAYVGVNNANAGRTAAYLFAQCRQGHSGAVLTTTSRRQFQGEEARARAFAAEMARLCPEVTLHEASGGAGLALETATQITRAAHGLGHLLGGSSMGGAEGAAVSTRGHAEPEPEGVRAP